MSGTSSSSLPATMRALVLEEVGKPLTIKSVPTPEAVPGSVVIKVLATTAEPNAPNILSGRAGFEFPTPFVPGGRAIGRVAAVGPDGTSLGIDQLVIVECFTRGRQDNTVQILFGAWNGVTPQSKKLMAEAWRNGTMAEYCRAPLENCYPVNEKILCEELGYTLPEILSLAFQVIGYGGLRGIDVKAGETVIIAPATGQVSGSAVGAAVAMGATVIAVSRNLEVLKQLQSTFPRVHIVQIKGDVEEDKAAIMQFGAADAYFDISPPAATGSTHFRSCFGALKQYGRASLMGTVGGDMPVPYVEAVLKSLTIHGQFMYEREHVRELVKMTESGVFKLGKSGGQKVVGKFPLGEVDKAFEVAVQNRSVGQIVVLEP